MSTIAETVRLDGYYVTVDEYGNMQLCCVIQLRSGKVYLAKDTADKFSALPHSGDKLIWFSNRVGRVDAIIYLEELDELELFDNGDGRLHYLFCREDMKRHPRRSWCKSAGFDV